MTQQEAIDMREKLLAEQRKLRLAVKVLRSDTIVPCTGVTIAINQYERRISEIDSEIMDIANRLTEAMTRSRQGFAEEAPYISVQKLTTEDIIRHVFGIR